MMHRGWWQRWQPRVIVCLAAFVLASPVLLAQQKADKPKPVTENDYYRLISFPIPDNAVLEVGGLDWYDAQKTKLLVCTRRGEIWQIDNVYVDEPALAGGKVTRKDAAGKTITVDPTPAQIVGYQPMLFGLHEPLGMVVRPDGIFVAQRGELSRLKDENKDGRIDLVEAFGTGWEISGGYHEYAFGPKLDRQGNFWVTLNRPFGEGKEGSAHWRGWALKIDPQGKMTPVCPGLRSPCGLGMNADGEMFYTDNQGDWTAVCKLSHLKPGSFQGEAWSLRSADHPLSTFKSPGKDFPKNGLLWPDAVKEMPLLMPPAVWFPYPSMGKSHSDVQCDETGGKFGPFAGQLFVGDQGTAVILRVFLEKIDGQYQGACFPFRRGFQSGVLRMCWGHDGSMFVGGTNRGWGGGSKPYSLERLVWTGAMPFEIQEMRVTPRGFRLTFTQAVDPESAGNVGSYAVSAWTYRYHSGYGDPPREQRSLNVKEAAVSADGRQVDLTIEGCQPYFVHELKAAGVRNREGGGLLHSEAYYTLNKIPSR